MHQAAWVAQSYMSIELTYKQRENCYWQHQFNPIYMSKRIAKLELFQRSLMKHSFHRENVVIYLVHCSLLERAKTWSLSDQIIRVVLFILLNYHNSSFYGEFRNYFFGGGMMKCGSQGNICLPLLILSSIKRKTMSCDIEDCYRILWWLAWMLRGSNSLSWSPMWIRHRP